MAAKKKTTTTKPPLKKKPTPTKPTVRVAMKLLETLPPIDARHRRVYLSAFSNEQCAAWGSRTKAATVVAEADKFVSEIAIIVKKKPITTYSPTRLAWLCTLITELDDAIAADSSEDLTSERAARNGLFLRASKARRQLANGLYAAAHGNETLEKAIANRNETAQSPHTLESTLAGLLQLATNLRRSDDGELIADDVGLSANFLSSVSAISDALREANQRTFGGETGGDSVETNLVEGRVLREMGFAFAQLKQAKDDGVAMKLPKPGAAFQSVRASRASPAEPTPDTTPG
jgi:hypothetical protein